MTLETQDKIIIGCTGAIIISACLMQGLADKVESKAKKLEASINSIDNMLRKTRAEVIAGNHIIEEGNALLLQLIKQDLSYIGKESKKEKKYYGK